MGNFFKIFGVLSLLTMGCSSSGAVVGNYEYFGKVDFVESGLDLPKKDNLIVGSFSHNERNWRPAVLAEFATVFDWLATGSFDSGKIILQKQVGEASLICEIRPRSVKFNRGQEKAEYLIFFVKKEKMSVDFEQVIKNKKIKEPKFFDYGPIKIVFDEADDSHQFAAPTVYFYFGDYLFEAVLIYKGLSRNYVNNVFNKFPWALLAN